jgi:hypothetical protein
VSNKYLIDNTNIFVDNYAPYGSISSSYPKSIEFSKVTNGDPIYQNITRRILINNIR